MNLTATQWILIVVSIAAVLTGLFLFPNTTQSTEVVDKYQMEITDEVEVIDLVIDVFEGETKDDVIAFVLEQYPGYEIIEIAQDNNRYLVRIKEVVE